MCERFFTAFDVGITPFAIPQLKEGVGCVAAAAIPFLPDLFGVVCIDGEDLAVQVVELAAGEAGRRILEV